MPYLGANRAWKPIWSEVSREFLTALDLCATVGGDAIDQALRTRATTLGQLYRALELTGGRKGNRSKRQLLLDSRIEMLTAKP